MVIQMSQNNSWEAENSNGNEPEKDDEKDRKESKNQEKKEEHQDDRIEKLGQVTLSENKEKQNIHLLTIIGEVE